MNRIKKQKAVHVVGGGLAGSEAAWQIAQAGIPVILHEMRQMNSLIMQMADKHKVPAGSALAIDRDHFSQDVTQTLEKHPLITISREEVTELPPADWGSTIIATGPLTSTPLAESIRQATGEDSLAFFDALAPIVHKDSINFDVAWFQSRYDKGDGKDYINCPMNKDEYETFLKALLESEKTQFKDWEVENSCGYFEGCMPIEVMAERGPETLRFGPMKPVGLTCPHREGRCHAVVQLRQDNKLGTLYNIVGFQTKMKHGAQKDVFRLIPGLENAQFARLGGIHRNTFLNSPKILDEQLRLKNMNHIRFAGQITGCEGYVESAAMGLMAGLMVAAEENGNEFVLPKETTSCGALLNHITKNANAETFQPMNVNFGLFTPLEQTRDERGKKIKGRDRKKVMTDRAKKDFLAWRQAIEKKAV